MNSRNIMNGRNAASAGSGRTRGATPPAAAAGWIFGRHAVSAALANPARRWRVLVAIAAQQGEAQALAVGAVARRLGAAPPVRVLDRAGIAALLPAGAVHQGLALQVEPLAEPRFDELLRRLATGSGRQIVVALDRVSDPHNLGAVLRSAAAFGGAAVLVARHGAPPAGGVLAKAASGALEQVPLVRVVNLVRALEALKAVGFWIYGLDAAAESPLASFSLGTRVALVLGAEGGGMRRLVRTACDHLARLPTMPLQPTLNVSCAAAAALYELVRAPTPKPR
jgi:23S rRNA (guanosine2251-2'-O)-methyltransferase